MLPPAQSVIKEKCANGNPRGDERDMLRFARMSCGASDACRRNGSGSGPVAAAAVSIRLVQARRKSDRPSYE